MVPKDRIWPAYIARSVVTVCCIHEEASISINDPLGIFQVLSIAIIVTIMHPMESPKMVLTLEQSQSAYFYLLWLVSLLIVVCVVKSKQPMMLLHSPHINPPCIKTLVACLIGFPWPVLTSPACDLVHWGLGCIIKTFVGTKLVNMIMPRRVLLGSVGDLWYTQALVSNHNESFKPVMTLSAWELVH